MKDEWRHWEEGKSLLFDDTYDHEVRNEAETVRVVLFVDFLRPLPGWVGRFNRHLKRFSWTVWRPSTRSAEHSCGIRQGCSAAKHSPRNGQSVSVRRQRAVRTRALSFAKQRSMGLRSGL